MGLQEAMVEATLKAKNHGFLSNGRSLAQKINKKKIPDWQERTVIADLKFLHQNGLTFNLYLVSKVVLDPVWFVVNMATRMPIYQCWYNPTIL